MQPTNPCVQSKCTYIQVATKIIYQEKRHLSSHPNGDFSKGNQNETSVLLGYHAALIFMSLEASMASPEVTTKLSTQKWMDGRDVP